MSYLHATKGDVYDNFTILHPNGERMCYCDEKKTKWYLKRGLAKSIDEKTIQLLFEPKGVGDLHLSKAYQNNNQNNCVVCGTDKNLTKHHVVPYQYRKHFPEEYKSHNHFDILPVCIEHHEEYEREADRLNVILKKELGICAKGNTITSPEIKRAKEIQSYISTLSEKWDQIPPKRRDELLHKIGEYMNIVDVDRESLSSLNIQIEQEVPSISPAMLIVGSQKVQVESFIVRWRKHFLETMKPQFMPNGWCDDAERFFYGK